MEMGSWLGYCSVFSPNLNTLIGVSKAIQAVKLCSNKMLQFLTNTV